MESSGAIKYGTELIQYRVALRPGRQTLGIEVHPDGAVVVLVPVGCDEKLLRDKLQRRAAWISRQLMRFSVFPAHPRSLQYLSGETFRYLGRRYRLRVVQNDASVYEDTVRLTRGRLVVSTPKHTSRDRVRILVDRWYRLSANQVFDDVVSKVFFPFSRRGVERPTLNIRRMKRRWGSLSSHGRMTLNVRLVEAPRACIEYVITHELCHLIHHDHGPAFWRLLTRMMPDWERRKERLEQVLVI